MYCYCVLSKCQPLVWRSYAGYTVRDTTASIAHDLHILSYTYVVRKQKYRFTPLGAYIMCGRISFSSFFLINIFVIVAEEIRRHTALVL